MKIANLNNIKKYWPLLVAIMIFLFIYQAAVNRQKGSPTEETAQYTYISKHSQLAEHFLNEAVDYNLSDIENQNPNLKETERTTNLSGYISTTYRDEKETPVRIFSDRNGKVVATMRPVISDFERNVTLLKNRLDLSDEPSAIMYPSKTSIAVVHVYLKDGIAIFFEEEFGNVEYIITFGEMNLNEFKAVFQPELQDERNPLAY